MKIVTGLFPKFEKAAEIAALLNLFGGEAGTERAAEIGDREPLLTQEYFGAARITVFHIAFKRVEDDLHPVRLPGIAGDGAAEFGQRVGEEIRGDAAETGATVPQRVGQGGQIRIVDGEPRPRGGFKKR